MRNVLAARLAAPSLRAIQPGNAVYRLHDGDLFARHSRRIGGRGDGMVPGAASRWAVPGKGLPSPAPPSGAMPFTYSTDLSEVRTRVRSQARRAGLAEARASDLVLAVSEVAANTVRHARSQGTLTIWHDENEIVCEIRDKGVISDPLAGQRRPAIDAGAGHGLWIVHQVCDKVEIASGSDGTTIRMHMSIRAPNAGS